ncbi:hypothetical protein KEM56_006974 [Ascosphaera pollenicola]|nr:hypothetical protein KEM56_006974 [Ascosphaera pollenicola]
MKLSLLFTAAVAAAAPLVDDGYAVHERRAAVPADFKVAGRPSPYTKIPVRVGLTQSNLDNVDKLLLEVSDPKSKKYGQYYTEKEVHDLFAPSNESAKVVTDFLHSSGINRNRVHRSRNKQWLQFDATPAEAEKVFKAKYLVYSSKQTGKKHIATDKYHLPKAVQKHVDYVTPGVKLSEYRKVVSKHAHQVQPSPKATSKVLAKHHNLTTCNKAMGPACIKAMYKIPDGGKATPGNELGIYEQNGNAFAQEDLDLFFKTFYPQIPQGTTPKIDSVDGGKAPVPVNESGLESCLDFDLAYPIIWPQSTVLFQNNDDYYNYVDTNFTGFLNTFLDAVDGSYCDYIDPADPQYPDPHAGGYNHTTMCGVYKMPNVLSISYGGSESGFTARYARRQCYEWAKLGMQGKTVVVASGDTGVSGNTETCLGEDEKVFGPAWPAACPYMTAVGSTFLGNDGSAELDNEIATTNFPSGGGFSNIFERASWQNDAIEKYFEVAQPKYPYYKAINRDNFDHYDGLYNRIGRGYPDLSAAGDYIAIVNQGKPGLAYGTSASTPIFASILTLINEELIERGKPTVGFVNPILYANPDAFNDVTVGNNSGCGTPGFEAAKGWDPVTGLGTPNYQKLLEVFLSATD